MIAAPLAGQDSQHPERTRSAAAKSKKIASSPRTEEAAKEGDHTAKTADSDNAQPAKTDEAKPDEAKNDDVTKAADEKKEDATPPPSPQLIQIPQDETTSAPKPKIPAVFVFTNGDRIESDDYLITKDALYINKNGQKTRYPINTVDRATTKAANQDRGVEIVFPKSKSEFNLDF